MTTPSDMEITPPRRSFWRNLSPVWLVPVLAVAVSLGIAWQSFADRGTLIEIEFENAAGVVAGTTEIRYRDVAIGMVETVSFTPDMQQVTVGARIDRTAAEALSAQAQFWVVRPQVSARGISGLNTVLSGVYIEAALDPGSVPDGSRRFTGRDDPPLVMPGRQGTRITLRAPDGNRLTPGAPILFRGVEVGAIEAPRLLDGAEGVLVDGFIEAPYDRRLSTTARFWDTSGFAVSLGTGGLRLSVGNLASILTGGIAFDTLTDAGEPIDADTVFELYSDEDTAMASSTSVASPDQLRIAAEFDGSVQGLSPGAAVRFRGVRVGEVTGIAARQVDMGPAPLIRMQAALALDPSAFGLGSEASPERLMAFLEAQVAAGLRARLSASGVFSTSLVVELLEVQDSPPERLLRPEDALPVIPSAPSDLTDLTTSAQGLIERLTELPIEGVLQQAINLMEAAEDLLEDEGTRALPSSVVSLVDDARDFVGSEALQALPGDIQGTVGDLRAVLARFEEQRAVETLVETMEAVQGVAANIDSATTEVPALISEVRRVVGRIGDLDAEGLVNAARDLLNTADTFLDDEGTQAVPPALAGALREVELALAELRGSGLVDEVSETLGSARSAADAIATATQDLPQLAERLNGLVAQAEALVAAYGARSPVNEEALATLREARDAARAFAQLARTLERSPNSILFGR
ncbi:paraquat-inducible protein B [Pararhodobacter marinus]|uniref:Paraquat-inducible protein B n=1 Tax=Pararhodobacter marinus TaxID=2184063 RepID=A0A2U2C8E3_9RHOB|nr:MlaD family protein [Pararhodobacter marinus]PWE28119.1 paraquat-inducible protein B [Pararhodobacter marinus]